ncbi:CopG family transcriptional regulator (plasmid) [Mycobacterium kubicae]|uniref:ribbon-helix-helix domain-containing protein n=1 Tax=Mycobacterium kubicae TaxID=120959 RepID=UPI000EA9288D|nr:ribbon-helix-helix domain-containing protein [Mycobacterium kubicae]QNI09771.1 CopG family transcriptional regulator [Mycobacterium kubicae]
MSETAVPNQPKTPIRAFRIPDELYEQAQAKARQSGVNLSDVVRAALLAFIETDWPLPPRS